MSNNLDVQEIPGNSNNNYIDHNTAVQEIILAMTEKRSIAVTADVNWSTGDAQDVNSGKYKALRCFYIEFTGAQGAGRTFTIPDNKKPYWIKNSCTGGFNTTFKNVSGTGVAIANGQLKYVYCNGTDIEVLI